MFVVVVVVGSLGLLGILAQIRAGIRVFVFLSILVVGLVRRVIGIGCLRWFRVRSIVCLFVVFGSRIGWLSFRVVWSIVVLL